MQTRTKKIDLSVPLYQSLYVRVCRRPMRDLDRGYSYAMGAFGNEDAREAGLSCFELNGGLGVERLQGCFGSLTKLNFGNIFSKHDRLRRNAVVYLAVFAGEFVTCGTDNEDCIKPRRLVCKLDLRKFSSDADVIEHLRALGFDLSEI